MDDARWFGKEVESMRATDGDLDIWDRWAPLGGIVFAVGFVIAAILYFSGGGPAHDTPASVHSYILAHRTALESSWWFLVIGEIGVLVYIMGLTMVFLRRTGAWGVALLVLLASGIIAIATGLIEDGVAFNVLYTTVNKTSADVTYALYTTANTFISDMESIAVGLTVLAAGSLTLTTGAFRRWVGWLGVACGLLTILGSTVGAVVDAVSVAGVAGGILSLVFVAVTSISMMGRQSALPGHVPAGVAP